MMNKGFRTGREYVDEIFVLKHIGMKAREKKCSVYEFHRFKEALWQVLRMYDGGGKLLNGIKSMYVDSSACVRIKRGVSEQFRINSWVRQGFIISLWLFNVYMDGAMKEVKMMGMGRRGMSFLKDGRD